MRREDAGFKEEKEEGEKEEDEVEEQCADGRIGR